MKNENNGQTKFWDAGIPAFSTLFYKLVDKEV